MTISPLLQWLGIVKRPERQAAYEFSRGKLQAAGAALEELERMSHVHFSHNEIRAKLKEEYRQRIEEEERQICDLQLDHAAVAAQESRWARRHLLLTEKNQVIESFRQGTVSQEVYEKLLADIDARLLRLESGEEEGTMEAVGEIDDES